MFCCRLGLRKGLLDFCVVLCSRFGGGDGLCCEVVLCMVGSVVMVVIGLLVLMLVGIVVGEVESDVMEGVRCVGKCLLKCIE